MITNKITDYDALLLAAGIPNISRIGYTCSDYWNI
jgi:hypothetical protein